MIACGELFTAFTFAAVALLVILFLRFPFLQDKIPSLSLGLILGGALGNLADRLARGCVIDFIDLSFWPVFNIADVGIALGSLLLFIFLMRALVGEREER